MQYWNNFVTNVQAHYADDGTLAVLTGCVIFIIAFITIDKLTSKGA